MPLRTAHGPVLFTFSVAVSTPATSDVFSMVMNATSPQARSRLPSLRGCRLEPSLGGRVGVAMALVAAPALAAAKLYSGAWRMTFRGSGMYLESVVELRPDSLRGRIAATMLGAGGGSIRLEPGPLQGSRFTLRRAGACEPLRGGGRFRRLQHARLGGLGMVLAAFLFMRRMAEVTNVHAVTRELADAAEDGYDTDPAGVRRRSIPKGVEVYEIDGPFFFGAAEQFGETLSSIGSRPRVLIIRMRSVPAMDSTGLHALGEIVHRSRGEGTRVILSDVHSQPMAALGRSRLLDEFGDENLVGSLDDALAAARAHLEQP